MVYISSKCPAIHNSRGLFKRIDHFFLCPLGQIFPASGHDMKICLFGWMEIFYWECHKTQLNWLYTANSYYGDSGGTCNSKDASKCVNRLLRWLIFPLPLFLFLRGGFVFRLCYKRTHWGIICSFLPQNFKMLKTSSRSKHLKNLDRIIIWYPPEHQT